MISPSLVGSNVKLLPHYDDDDEEDGEIHLIAPSSRQNPIVFSYINSRILHISRQDEDD